MVAAGATLPKASNAAATRARMARGKVMAKPKSPQHVMDQDSLTHPDPELVLIVGNLTLEFNPKIAQLRIGTKSTNSRDDAT